MNSTVAYTSANTLNSQYHIILCANLYTRYCFLEHKLFVRLNPSLGSRDREKMERNKKHTNEIIIKSKQARKQTICIHNNIIIIRKRQTRVCCRPVAVLPIRNRLAIGSNVLRPVIGTTLNCV